MTKRLRMFVWSILLAILFGGVFFATRYSSNAPVDWTGKREVTIELTSKGFVPKEVYVTKGTRVTFSASPGVAFWPASDLHPSHAIYPEFDPRTPVPAGSTWSFVFDKEGRWSYHNHLEATVTGVVIVVPVGFKGDERFDRLGSCDQTDTNVRKACWSEHLEYALDTKGLDAAFDEMGRLNISDPEFSKECHSFAHDLGLLAYGKYGDHVPLSVKAGYCNDGFWHGFMEGFFTRHHDQADAYAFCAAVQTKFKDTYRLAYIQCQHGIGHGSAEYITHTRADLWRDIPRLASIALAPCRSMAQRYRFTCAGGVYSVLGDWMHGDDRYASFTTPSKLFALCAQASDTWAQEGCAWEFAKRTRWSAKTLPDSFAAIIREGTVIEHGAYVLSMIESRAILIGEQAQNASDARRARACHTLSGTLQTACLKGIAEGLFFSAPPGQEVSRSAHFCLSDELSDSHKSACASAVLALASISYAPNALSYACTVLSDVVPATETACEVTR